MKPEGLIAGVWYSFLDERCCFGLRNCGEVFEIWNDVIGWYRDCCLNGFEMP